MVSIKEKVKECFHLANLLATGLNNRNVDQNMEVELLRQVKELRGVLPSTMEETQNALKTWEKNFSQSNHILLPYCFVKCPFNISNKNNSYRRIGYSRFYFTKFCQCILIFNNYKFPRFRSKP